MVGGCESFRVTSKTYSCVGHIKKVANWQPLRIAQAAAAGLALGTLVPGTIGSSAYSADLQTEYLMGRALRDGIDIFTPITELSARYFPFATSNFPHPSPYPPVVALLSIPLTLVPFPVLVPLWLLLNVLVLVAIGRWLGLSTRAGLAFAIWPPIWWVLRISQIELIVLALAMLAWRAAARGQEGRAGVWLGLATAIKFYPALFLLPFLVRRRYRIVVAAGLVVVAGQLGNLLVVGPTGLVRYYREILPGVAGLYVREGLNSSVYGALLRLLGGATDVSPLVPAPGLVLPLAVVASVLALICLAILRPEAAPLAALVAMPNAWGYYAVLALPQIVTLMKRPDLRRATLIAVLAMSVTLPVVDVLLQLVVSMTPRVGDQVLAIAPVLLALQPAGYVTLLALSVARGRARPSECDPTADRRLFRG
jgi:hypothetical protein